MKHERRSSAWPGFGPLLLAALLLQAGVARALPPENDAWIRVETANFTLYSDSPEEKAISIALDLERFRAALHRLHPGFSITSPRPTHFFLFKDAPAYRPYKQRAAGRPTEHAGLFFAAEDANYVSMQAEPEEEALHIIYHEYVHYFLSLNLAYIPVWLNEGLAEYYSTFEADASGARIGLPIRKHLSWLRANAWMPLESLFAVSQESRDYNEGTRMGTFYAQSWMLVHYLLHGAGGGNPDVSTFLDSLRDGASVEEAARSLFRSRGEDLRTDLMQYHKRKEFAFTQIGYDKSLAVEARVRVTPMSRDEMLYRLGDFLTHLDPGRAGEIEAHLQESLRLDPKRGGTYAALGLLRHSQDRFIEAAALFDKAVFLDPDDAHTCFLLARSLLHQSEGAERGTDAAIDAASPALARAREMLRKAIRLQPEFAAAHAELGASYVTAAGDVTPGIAALETARRLFPSEMMFAENLVHLYLRNDQPEEARALVEGVLGRAGNRNALASARVALQQNDEAHAPRTAGDRPLSPEEKARRAEAKQAVLQLLQEALERTQDPDERRRLEESIRAHRDGSDAEDLNRQVAAFNRAVALANGRDYQDAIALLQKLQPDIKDPELAAQTRDLLERLRKDARRLQRPTN